MASHIVIKGCHCNALRIGEGFHEKRLSQLLTMRILALYCILLLIIKVNLLRRYWTWNEFKAVSVQRLVVQSSIVYFDSRGHKFGTL